LVVVLEPKKVVGLPELEDREEARQIHLVALALALQIKVMLAYLEMVMVEEAVVALEQ
jgi:hypothetical protein